MKILSFVLSMLGLGSMLGASLIKGKRMNYILGLVLIGNLLIGISYHIDGGINGAVSCYLGAGITLVNYFFEIKNKPIPRVLSIVYMLAFAGLNLVVGIKSGISYLTFIVITASVIFVLCIGQKNGAKYRFWTLVNVGLWLVHDILAKTYGPLTSHAVQFLITLTGTIIHDRKK